MTTSKKWALLGYDTFSDEFYHIEGSYDTSEQALKAARDRLKELEELQPTEESGGQSENGIQDHVFVVSPEGLRIRVLEEREQNSLVAYA